MDTRWPKFNNIHRVIASFDLDETIPVVVTEKLDGSNLGLEVHQVDGLVTLLGRNCVLWKKGSKENPFDRSYGCVKNTLHPLAKVIPKLKSLAAKLIREESTYGESVVFFGEWYSSNESASWHPFGYAIRQKAVGEQVASFRTMTSERHKVFLEHDLYPPTLLFAGGNIYEAIDALLPMMLDPPNERFEGVFITNELGETRNCAKWKTGSYEEQTSFVISNKLICSERLQDAVVKLKKVFDLKTKAFAFTASKMKKRDGVSKQPTEKEKEIDRQIMLALMSVLSKSPSTAEDIRAMGPSNFSEEMKRITKETYADVSASYAASDMKPPKEVKKRLGMIVSTFILCPEEF